MHVELVRGARTRGAFSYTYLFPWSPSFQAGCLLLGAHSKVMESLLSLQICRSVLTISVPR